MESICNFQTCRNEMIYQIVRYCVSGHYGCRNRYEKRNFWNCSTVSDHGTGSTTDGCSQRCSSILNVCVDMFDRESNEMGLVWCCSVSIAFDIPSMIGNPDSRRYRFGIFVTWKHRHWADIYSFRVARTWRNGVRNDAISHGDSACVYICLWNKQWGGVERGKDRRYITMADLKCKTR